MTTLKPPAQAMVEQITGVDDQMNVIFGQDLRAEEIIARASIAQAKATCALVHAVRDLADQIRTLRQP